MPTLNIYLTDDEFERLTKIKEKIGLTWKGVLVHGTGIYED